jgi:hypothetical protein
MLKYYIVELGHIDALSAILLLGLVHLAWLIQSARVLAMLFTGNWDPDPVVYPRLLALLCRRKPSKTMREKPIRNGRKDAPD